MITNLTIMEILNYLKVYFPDVYKQYNYSNMLFDPYKSSMSRSKDFLHYLRSNEIDKLQDVKLNAMKKKIIKNYDRAQNLLKLFVVIFVLLIVPILLVGYFGSGV